MTTTRVTLQVDIEVDTDAWVEEYGLANSAGAVSKDIRSYVRAALWGMPICPLDVQIITRGHTEVVGA